MVTTCFRRKKKELNMVWSFRCDSKKSNILFKKKLSYLNDSPDKTLLF